MGQGGGCMCSPCHDLSGAAQEGIYLYTCHPFVMVAAFFEKQHIVSEKGVDIEYHLFGMVMHNYWSWDEVTTMHPDYIKARPNVMLHIGKDIVTRSFIMTVSDANGILELAQRMNSSIYIKDIR